VNDIYVVSVNDIFVVNAWKESLSGNKETVKFAGDDQGKLAQALGLVLDATGGLGSKRLIRSALIVEDGKVVNAIVEPVSGKSESE
jgi:2-Cys peroxiredoxin 5